MDEQDFNEGRTRGRQWAILLATSGQLHVRLWAGSHGRRHDLHFAGLHAIDVLAQPDLEIANPDLRPPTSDLRPRSCYFHTFIVATKERLPTG
jgi:hypothetical protein